MPDTQTNSAPVAVEVTRGGAVESRHRASAVVVDAGGKVMRQWGNIDQAVFPRSAIKSIQALPLIETGAAEAYDLGDSEIALACASHGAESFHTETVSAWLARIGLTEADLECGAHLPSHQPSLESLLRGGNAVIRHRDDEANIPQGDACVVHGPSPFEARQATLEDHADDREDHREEKGEFVHDDHHGRNRQDRLSARYQGKGRLRANGEEGRNSESDKATRERKHEESVALDVLPKGTLRVGVRGQDIVVLVREASVTKTPSSFRCGVRISEDPQNILSRSGLCCHGLCSHRALPGAHLHRLFDDGGHYRVADLDLCPKYLAFLLLPQRN